MTEQSLLFTDATVQTHVVRSIRASLTESGVVFAFTLAEGPLQAIHWRSTDPVMVRDIARQLVSLAEALPGAPSMCLCDLFKPPCPVHQGFFPAQPDGPLESLEEGKP